MNEKKTCTYKLKKIKNCPLLSSLWIVIVPGYIKYRFLKLNTVNKLLLAMALFRYLKGDKLVCGD